MFTQSLWGFLMFWSNNRSSKAFTHEIMEVIRWTGEVHYLCFLPNFTFPRESTRPARHCWWTWTFSINHDDQRKIVIRKMCHKHELSVVKLWEMCSLFTENVSSLRISKSFWDVGEWLLRSVRYIISLIWNQRFQKSFLSLGQIFVALSGPGLFLPTRQGSFRGRSAVSFPEQRLVMEPIFSFLVVNVWVNFKSVVFHRKWRKFVLSLLLLIFVVRRS